MTPESQRKPLSLPLTTESTLCPCWVLPSRARAAGACLAIPDFSNFRTIGFSQESRFTQNRQWSPMRALKASWLPSCLRGYGGAVPGSSPARVVVPPHQRMKGLNWGHKPTERKVTSDAPAFYSPPSSPHQQDTHGNTNLHPPEIPGSDRWRN